MSTKASLLCSDCVSAASSTGRNAIALVPVELLDELLQAEDLPRAHRRVHADEVVQVVRRLRRPDARVRRGGLHPRAVRLQHVPGSMNTRAYGISSLRCAAVEKVFPRLWREKRGGRKVCPGGEEAARLPLRKVWVRDRKEVRKRA